MRHLFLYSTIAPYVCCMNKQYNTLFEIASRIDLLVFDTMRRGMITKREAVQIIRKACPELFEQLASYPQAATNPYLTKFK